ncbi:ABC transporter permease [Variovorax sp. LG9.2]|uniref:ABC transporter permease n=1 Tax=Variovorax sp. LG9.2 TaxID=3048626 RepID=UPI002B229BFC|nr:ABC transporter permease [Variovorax sp. LG9.2]MEB0059714.1 ABC transporter permease [Variovorax sp. LG9.2]
MNRRRFGGSSASRRLQQHSNRRIDLAVVGISSVATVVPALMTAILPEPWYGPRYVIPLMDIALNSATLGLDSFFEGVVNRRQA